MQRRTRTQAVKNTAQHQGTPIAPAPAAPLPKDPDFCKSWMPNVGRDLRRVYNVKIERLPEHKLAFAELAPKPSPHPAPAPAHGPAQAPSTVDLRPKMPPVYDQGNLGSCTANALCAAFAYDCPAAQPFMGSRLFLYYNERMVENDIPDDAGACIYDGVACLKKYGLCAESDWPYVIAKFAQKPPVKCYTSAVKHEAIVCQNIQNTSAAMKACLQAGYPFVVGISVYDSFESDAVAMTGAVPMPGAHEQCLGGHAVVCVGYNDSQQTWIMRNSWGASWGLSGYFTLPYAYLLDPNMCSDLWVIKSVSNR